MRKPVFCICENKAADQLCGNRTANQRLCFRYIDRTIPFLHKSVISSLWPSTTVQLSLLTLSEILKTGFLVTRLNYGLAESFPSVDSTLYITGSVDSIGRD